MKVINLKIKNKIKIFLTKKVLIVISILIHKMNCNILKTNKSLTL